MCVCVFTAVCVHFGWVNCRAQIPSMCHHTWPYVTSLINASLSLLLKKGNIFLVDHVIMDGIPANVIRDKTQHIAAPLCLLYEHPEKGLIPIAIQVKPADSHLLRIIII